MLIIGRKEDPHKLLLLIETRNMIVSTQDKSFVTSRSEIFESTRNKDNFCFPTDKRNTFEGAYKNLKSNKRK